MFEKSDLVLRIKIHMQLIGASHSIAHAIACAGLLASTAFAAINTDQAYRLVIDGGRSYCDNYLSAPR